MFPAVTVPRLFADPDRVVFSANVVVPVAPTVIAGEASDPCKIKLSAEDFIIKFAISYPCISVTIKVCFPLEEFPFAPIKTALLLYPENLGLISIAEVVVTGTHKRYVISNHS